MMSIAEAVFFATIGSNPNIKQGVQKFQKWHKKLSNKLRPIEERSTVWDKLDRARKRGKPTLKM